MHRLVLIFFFSVFSYQVSAQTWEVGGFLGGSGYMGDLNLVNPYKLTNPAFGFQFKRNFDSNWSAKLNFMQGKVQANDASSSNTYQKDRNLNFRSPISELSLQAEFNLFKYAAGAEYGYGNRKFSPYLFTGIAYFSFNPMTDYNGDEIELRLVETENVAYKTSSISIPYGAGVKYNIGGNFTLIGEIGYRTTFTDYLDDVSGKYIDFAPGGPINPKDGFKTIDLADRSTPLNTPGTQRGDGRKPRDTYIFSGLSLTYTFVPIKCPTF